MFVIWLRLERTGAVTESAQENKSLMLEIYDDKGELFQNVLAEYSVYSLFHTVRDVSKIIHDQDPPIQPNDGSDLYCCLGPSRATDEARAFGWNVCVL